MFIYLLEQQRLEEMSKTKEEYFQTILKEHDPHVRGRLWRQLVNLTNRMGEGVSKTMSKLYHRWFKTARLGRDASLELDYEYVEFSWNGIRLDIDQLKEWLVRHIISKPLEHRSDMISKCQKFLSFQSDQQVVRSFVLFSDFSGNLRSDGSLVGTLWRRSYDQPQ
jgi:hypothetical protein